MDCGTIDQVKTSPNDITVVRQFMTEVFDQGNMERLPDLVAPSYVGHFSTGDHFGPEGVRIDIATYRNAFPDLTVRLDDLFSCRTRVIRRFTLRGTHIGSFQGRSATGKSVVFRGIGLDRVDNGKLAESWVLVETLPHAAPRDFG